MNNDRPNPEPDLDPDDWDAFSAQCHQALDDALDYLRTARERPVWQPLPQSMKDALRAPLPEQGQSLAGIRDELNTHILPYATGNTHPRFFGWVHGTGTPGNVMADIYLSAMNANLGGRDHAPIYVERQVVEWFCRLFGFAQGAGGLLVLGTSSATINAMAMARNRVLGEGARRHGLQGAGSELVGYASTQVHDCASKAFQLLGLGSEALRQVRVRDDFTIDLDALQRLIARDRAAGRQPFCVIGSAGTVNTGVVDPLDALADVCAREALWFHVDGAFGALAILDPLRKPLLKGIERADSLAFDFHKWLHVQYDAGCLLVRDQRTLFDTFATKPDYLMSSARGLAAGEPWFSELGNDLSRGFRALRVWFTLKEHGTQGIGACIRKNCEQAAYLGELVDAHEQLERLAPVVLNIVNFRFIGADGAANDIEQLNIDIVADLQESGIAAPSTTRVNGALSIRVNITNHRTQRRDMDILVNAVLDAGRRRVQSPGSSAGPAAGA